MYITTTTTDGNQRLVNVADVRSISFEVDARRGPLTLLVTRNHGRILFEGGPADFFERFAMEQRQLTLLFQPLT